MSNNALVLLSGGIDSATCLAIAKSKHDSIYTISFDYAQKHISELIAAKKLAEDFFVSEHIIYKVDPSAFLGSALTDESIAVPNATTEKKIKSTYVPARNLILLSIATAMAEVKKTKFIYFGANKADIYGFPDCRPAFIKSFQETANLATQRNDNKEKYSFETPLLNLDKNQIILMGIKMGIDYSKTVTCYRANIKGEACGTCDSCIIRKDGFLQAGVCDPTLYFDKNENND